MDTPTWLPELETHVASLLGCTGRCSVTGLLSPTGRNHTTTRVSTPDGQVFVAKWFAGADGAKRHHRTLESIAGSDVPAPSPVGFIELSPDNGSVVVMERLPGAAWYMCAGDPALDRARTDAAVDVMVRVEAFAPEGLPWQRTPFACLRDGLEADTDEYRRRMSMTAAPPIAHEATELLASLAAIEPWNEVADHGDFGPHNLLCQAGRITGLIDWDRVAIQDCSKPIGTASAEILCMNIPIEQRAALVKRFLRSYADVHNSTEEECRMRALPHALTRTLDWLLYAKAAPAAVHEESLRELFTWRP